MAKICLDLEFRGPFHKLFALAQASSTMLSFFGVTSLYGLKIYGHMHNTRVRSFSEMDLYVHKLLLGDFSICLLHLILTAPCFLFWFSVLRTFGFQLFSISGGSQWHKLDFSQLLGIATESCSWGWAGSVKYCKFWLNKALLIQGESCSGWPLGVIENGQLGTNNAITDLEVRQLVLQMWIAKGNLKWIPLFFLGTEGLISMNIKLTIFIWCILSTNMLG